MREELFKGLTDEQIKKVKECKSSEEILSLAKAEGVQLSDEQLEAVSGGCKSGNPTNPNRCPECGAKVKDIDYCFVYNKAKCEKCGTEFFV